MKAKITFSPLLTLKFNLYVTDTGPHRPNVLPMWPTRQKELPTPDLVYLEIDAMNTSKKQIKSYFNGKKLIKNSKKMCFVMFITFIIDKFN